LFCFGFLIRRRNDPGERDHLVSGFDLDAHQVRGLLAYEVGFYGCRDRRIIDLLTCGLAGHGCTAAQDQESHQYERRYF
jgi:hypothetical protein